jgi:hypothetical protein
MGSNLDERSIQIHLKKHGMDSRVVTVRSFLTHWKQSLSTFKVLISTSVALVGNENPRCRYLACAGYLYDSVQIVQAFGRLRKNM